MDGADQFEALERAVNEIDALEAIYGNSDDLSCADGSDFQVISLNELQTARSIISGLVEDEAGKLNCGQAMPQLEVEISTSIEDEDGDHEDGSKIPFRLRCCLPPLYPERAAAIVSVSIESIRRSLRDELTIELKKKAESMIGVETVMELVEEARVLIPGYIEKERSLNNRSKPKMALVENTGPIMLGRRWIWVHHITNSDRRKQIVREATDLKLGGYLKSGYPGVIVVEGDAAACDEFVTWVKGNKSRPGGFGRNWGHHVRGQLNFSIDSGRSIPQEFEEHEDLAVLSRLCCDRGLEDEFLEYVMQHKGGTS